MLSAIKKRLDFWYFRFLLVTELFIVEKWERVLLPLFGVLFLLMGVFNNLVVKELVGKFAGMDSSLNADSGGAAHQEIL